MKIYKTVALLLLLINCLPANIMAQQAKVAKLRAYIHRSNQLGLFNGNILVADNNQVIYTDAIGYADASKQTPLTTKYRFHIGSIAKEFDAVGIMMMQERGKLSLDDKVSKFYPELPSWAQQISVKNLLQYTSGLPDVKWKTVHSDADNWKDLQALQKLNTEPGTVYAYNNNNVFLRRRIIEKITGISFSEFVQQEILKSVGINDAIIDPTNNDPLIAKSFNDDFKQDDLTVPISGWTCFNLDDFYKWAQCITRFCNINPASTLAIMTPVGPGKQCGLGGGSMKDGKVITHVHDGSALNYQALLATDATKGRNVIVLTSQKQGNVYELNSAIQAILDGKPYPQPRKSILKDYQEQLDSLSGVQALSFYNTLKAKSPRDYGFDSEFTLNEIGYFFLGQNQVADAITVFEYNTKLFPVSGNVYDSLGEAYLKQGDKKNALLNYKKSVQYDPANQSAKSIIAGLEQ
ncbi:MAG: tetratricopeptide repeat protein [Mucilaginibacter sp.]|nr:tetratricopeptide repeat protein [Mucilaginibacter sp.]